MTRFYLILKKTRTKIALIFCWVFRTLTKCFELKLIKIKVSQFISFKYKVSQHYCFFVGALKQKPEINCKPKCHPTQFFSVFHPNLGVINSNRTKMTCRSSNAFLFRCRTLIAYYRGPFKTKANKRRAQNCT